MQTPDEINNFLRLAMAGNLAQLQALHQQGYSLDLRDSDGETALCEACRCGQIEVVQWLIDSQADVNFGSDKGTPLYIAAYSGHREIVEILLKTSAYVMPHRTNNDRLLDIWIAAAKGCTSLKPSSFKMVEWAAEKVHQAFQALPQGHYHVALQDHHVSDQNQKKLSDSWKRYEAVPECASSARCKTV